ncbi:MAG: capsular polysaccharide biosynthesis protein [Paracoccaceae bacterium]|nr:capsular polysaccharide biosynthesis protein [Paracoccaceae bacterium]
MLALAGYRISLGLPQSDDLVGIWGASPTAHRGLAVAERRGAAVVRIEDAFLRSLQPGRSGEPPLGLLIDHSGMHFDAQTPSDLETLLATHPLDDSALMARARGAIARIREAHLTKYSAVQTDLDPPEPGYVLVIDQTRGDASVRASRGDRARFLEMLTCARQDYPNTRIIIKSHPETQAGHRPGHYRDSDLTDLVTMDDRPISPWMLLEGAVAVYTLSSQMGFEAILAGHRPRVFGTPFYAGWGLTEDETPVNRRRRRLSRAQLFAAAMILFPKWYDPYRDRLCEIEDVLACLEAQSRAWREDRQGWVARGMRLWKRAPLQKFFGAQRRLRFEDDVEKSRTLAASLDRREMVWAGKAIPQDTACRIEDGFLRSRGLGAELIPPLSLVVDKSGVYYDPTQNCDLESRIREISGALRLDQTERSEALMRAIRANKLSKYNLSEKLPPIPSGHRILVPGQVEDDASILKGSPDIQSNEALLRRAREENPSSVILYKPHPDVRAGLRKGVVQDAERYADLVIEQGDIGALLLNVDEVWTLTSLTGFEALLRGCRVTVLGAPFYAGWGLTRDLGPVPARRMGGPRPSLEELVHATMIDYPRYFDPVTNLPCPVEVVVDRLATGQVPKPGPINRTLAKLQGLFASQAHLWRR